MSYKLIKEDSIKDIGDGFIYEHIKTGARVVYIKNNDKNKVFSIAFRTLPKDNTGVFHILEHCVLCGSRKYPLKEPFNQLDKCTLNTYLNAITFSDKTLYPVGSINDKDYFKLVDVYLDAVFFPLIYEKKGIFLQEGWHFNGKEINGVVYNEMRGEYSSPDTIIDFKVKDALFEGLGYGNDSGGHPDYIKDLTYEQLKQFHKEYYSPTNSIIYFYGDLDIDYYLKYLNYEYLSKFQKGNIKDIYKKTPLKNKKIMEGTYFLEDELLENKNYIQASFKLKFSMEEEKSIAFEIISDILTENQEGVLKKALVEEGICTDVSSYIDDDMLEPIFTIQIEETNEKDVIRFKNILENSIRNIKIDEDMIRSSITPIEFYYKEKDFGYKPKGLFYNIMLLKNMLYGKYDFNILNFENTIKSAINIDLKKLLKENILDNEDSVYFILKAARKKNFKNDFNYNKNTHELIKYQNEKDKQEDLKKIPPLNIRDIDKNIFRLNTEVRYFQKRPIIFNEIDSEIFYFNMIFDTTNIKENYSKYISIFVYLLGKLNTKNYNSNNLEQKINILLGFGNAFNGTMALRNNKFLPVMGFSTRILKKNLKEGFLIINEIFKNTLFDNKNKIKTLIFEFLYKCEMDILKDPKTYSLKRVKSYITEQFSYMEEIEGISFYYWLKDLCKDIDKRIDLIIENLKVVKENIFNLNCCYFGISSDNMSYKDSIELLSGFEFNNILIENRLTGSLQNLNASINEAFYTSSNVNYNAKASNIAKGKFNYTGYIDILIRIIQSDYIWEKIRTGGGAYGGDISITRDGVLCMYSYDDPNIITTYNNFDKIAEYIYNLNIDEETLHIYKIGTINIFDRLLKNYEINQIAMSRYFSKIDEETIYNEKQHILEANINDIKNYFYLISNAIKTSKICTIGNKEQLYKNKSIFNNIKRLI